MIDKDIFLAGMTALSGAYGREIDGAVQRLYFGILSPKITTDEFQQAIAATCATETFWPSPAVILGKVPRLAEDRPALALSHVNRVLSSCGGHRFLTFDRYQAEFDAPTKHALSAIGGLSAITNCTEERWASLAKKFAVAYREHEAGLPEVRGPVDHKQLAAGDR